MKRAERNKLMREIMVGEDLAELRQASLDLGLQFISRRKRRHRIVRATAVGVVSTLLVFVLLAKKQTDPPRSSLAVSSRALQPAADLPEPPHPVQVKEASIKFINDEQLLALFPNRSVALIGSPGRQQFVFLDKAVQ